MEEGYDAVIIDNFSNSKPYVLDRVKKITGKEALFSQGDIRDKAFLHRVFDEYKIEAVIHFAGLKAVGESVRIPIAYYQNNVVGTLNLLEVMAQKNVKNIIFSSSATVYSVENETNQ